MKIDTIVIAGTMLFCAALIAQAIQHAGELNNDRLAEIHRLLLPLNRLPR